MLFNRLLKNTFFILALGLISCEAQTKKQKTSAVNTSVENSIVVGANRTQKYIPLLKNKKIGIVGNQTSIIFKKNGDHIHLVDSLLAASISIEKVFSPEHGFRGKADAGEKVNDGIDTKTGLPLVSLYGSHKKPTPEQLKGIDIMIFDIQDVGVRFYTYISTLHYVMEACAENNILLLILDRPNPNGHYIDGPVLEKSQQSFVGMHPVPIVHGMTIGEYAQMINGENWLDNKAKCDLMVIKIKNYDHHQPYHIPIKPSPNLPNDQAINLYPSLCFFEGTNVNAGRGTDHQFQVFGSPDLDAKIFEYTYIPKPNEGAKHPKNKSEKCYGMDLTFTEKQSEINLTWLIKAYQNTKNKDEFFNSFFSKLAGTKKLRQQIESGMSEKEIKATWKKGLEDYKTIQKKYLLYR
ncbi:exo-beta-N-acetylmuramidase NamZ family protein [Mesonia aestuariivivens]|uniref:DUF1343 domain-containing protein n=1 Tax=Mesonia aestuariivivens TaxID=2796128 RepID=A0ABS6VZ22_9FLAO|nr:DUF1343 domain-containing protein [Mesonia aestuariivivens]MBW2960848.1 DUF1343 domain-containing protein [Mesonia aestuariivivens]